MKSPHTDRIASFVAESRTEDIPSDMLHVGKRLILDTLGNAVAGFSTPASRRAIKTIQMLGGTPSSTIFMTGHRTAPPQAVFANVTMAATLEADDTCRYIGHHGQSSILPALALGEQRGLSGAAFLTASLLAYEASARIASACRHIVKAEDGSLLTNPSGGGVNWSIFAATFSASRAIALDLHQTKMAMGIAGFNASIPTAARYNRPNYSNLKYNPYAFLAQNGTLAALLVENGFTGDDAILDNDPDAVCQDWWKMAGIIGSDPEGAFASLGSDWFTRQTSFKPYPGCRFGQGAVGLFEQIIAEHDLKSDEIEHIDVYTDATIFHYRMDDPTVLTEEDAQFSIPHIMALTAMRVRPGPAWVSPRYWNDPQTESLKAKVSCHVYDKGNEATLEQLLAGRWERYPHRVVVQARGKTFERQADYIFGDPHSPETTMSDERLIAKFRDFTEQGLPKSQAERCIELVMSLETLETLAPLIDCLH
jgi:2-methylcitrate dehydratase PrpD